MSKDKKSSGGINSQGEVLLHRDLSTNTQLGMLLSVCNSLAGVLFSDEQESANIPGKRLLPGEAKIAAESAFVDACERVQSIIKDDRRWGIEYQMEIEKNYKERHAAQLLAIKAAEETDKQRKASMETMTLPHCRYKPMLFHTETGWVAFLGQADDIESGILGIGSSPGEALKSFDRTFEGELSAEVQAWLKQHETNLEKGIPTKEPFPKDENDKPLDPETDRAVEEPPSRGENHEGDSSVAGAQPEVR